MNPKKLRLLLLTLLTLTLANFTAFAQEIKSGEDLLRAMHDQYAKSWYETLTFTQKSTTIKPDGTTDVGIWHEALGLPGKLRIDVGDPSKSDGYLMVSGTLAIFQDGAEVKSQPLVNMLMVLGFDVYRQAPETTAAIVKNEGYDLKKLREDTWQGQPVYVVGADKGDLKSKQFWVEKKRLLFVRLFEPTTSEPIKVQEVRFGDYRELAGGWVAASVEVYVEDKKTFTEEYSDIKPNVKLDPGTFDPKQFASTHWEKP
jgi:outer membrane lipoprotein-sorting protein